MVYEILSSNGEQEHLFLPDNALEPRSSNAARPPRRPREEVADARIALARETRAESVAVLNQILADTMTLRDLYKKHHWQTFGATFYQLHTLFDRHHAEQLELVDTIAERIQTLGGTAIAMAADVAVTTTIALPPAGREDPLRQLARLLDAHECVLLQARTAARRAGSIGDDGTQDLLVAGVIRGNEKQAWFVRQLAEPSPV